MLKDSVDAQDRLFINNNSSSSSYSYQRQLLPIFNYKSHILYAIEKYSVVVLISDTGTGKSTQIPQYLVESGWASEGSMILCTQPRRVAVMTISDRVAKERNSILGEEVGYSIRFEKKLSEELTKIKYCTDGVLIREMMSDPMLLRYSVIMIDEAHERSLNTDILFGLLKKVQKKRPELRIIVASATMDAQIIKSFFETNTKKPSSSSSSVALVNINSSSITNTQSVGLKRKGLPITTVSSTLTSSSNDDNDEEEDSCCILQITGKMYQVDICYLSEPCRNYLQTTIDTVLNIHKYEDTGDILVFLPGSEDIDDVIRGLRELYTGSTLYFLPLYAALHTRAQLEVFKPTPDGYRKVVIATNIAETSITIPGVKYVIDSGFVKLNYFDFHRGVEMLITCPISQASAQQRAGRCGRTQPGKCFRLLTESAYSALPFHTVPEIQRVNVSWSILQMKAMGIDDVLHFDYISPPSVPAMLHAIECLYSLGALDSTGAITQLGEQLALFPVEPQLAKLLIQSYEYGCGEEILTIVSMCSVDHPFITPRHSASTESKQRYQEVIREFVSQQGDHFTLLNIYRAYQDMGYTQSWCDSNCLNHKILSSAKEMRKNLKLTLKHFAPPGGQIISCVDDYNTIKKCLVSAYFAHIAKLGHDGNYHLIKTQVTLTLHETSVYATYGKLPEWVLFNEMIQSKVPQIKLVSSIQPLWVVEIASHFYDLDNLSIRK